MNRKPFKTDLSQPHVWLACRIIELPDWEILGIYTTREKAITRCKTVDDWVVAIPLNTDLPDEAIVFETEEFPLKEDSLGMLTKNQEELEDRAEQIDELIGGVR